MSPTVRVPRRRGWRLLFAGLLACGLLLGFAAISFLTLSRDASWLRSALREERDDAQWSTVFQGDAGPILVGALRWGLRYHEGLEPRIHHALAAVRRASVGVYRLEPGTTEGSILPFPEARDGWSRLAAVRDNRDTVVVYVREPAAGATTLSVALAVQERGQVVVVSGEIAPEHLLPLIPARS